MRQITYAMFALVAWLAADSALAVVIPASKDNTLYESTAGDLSNGAGPGFFAGRSNQASNSVRRGLIQFDVAGHIPAGSVITGATLTLHAAQVSGGSRTVQLHRVLAEWGEGTSNAGGGGGGGAAATTGDATWQHTFFNSATWGTAGGDFSGAVSASAVVNGVGFYSWSSPGLLADAQQWLDQPATNFGWLLRGDESTIATSKRFDSRESSDEDFAPRLDVEFTIVPEPATGLLALAAIIPLALMRRRAARSRSRRMLGPPSA